MSPRVVGGALMLVLVTNPALAQTNGAGVPSPASVLGFEVGADRRLADWDEITRYMNVLADASDRVELDTLETTTLGRPFIMLKISSPENLAQSDRWLGIQRRLADPRRVSSEAEAERLIEEGRVIVLITAAIHSTEVGAYQVPLRVAHRLASREDETTLDILRESVVLLVPSLNPDGAQMVTDWYEGTIGKPWEGAGPPFLYHYYVGHDNNRDWYAFTQRETQIAVKLIHNVWHPQIIHDIHQMGSRGPRFFLPPWTDPIEPNVDPLLIAGVNGLGTSIAWDMYAAGKTGIVVNAIYDAWTPARAYQHYHAGVRVLSETASARLASPIHIDFEELGARRGANAREASWRFPEPWPGGEWHLRDIVDYMESGAMSLLKHAALNRETWLRTFYRVGRRAIEGNERRPAAYVIAPSQASPDGLAELIRILVTGAVEVRIAQDEFAVEGERFPAGSYVIEMNQPYSSFAKTLLEVQRYPELREYEGGPVRAPYDVTAHTLPLMMGVEVVASAEPLQVTLSSPIDEPIHGKSVPGLTNRRRVPRVGLYESWVPSMDAGWTRWLFDQYGIQYMVVHDSDMRRSRLGERFDAIILPDQEPEAIVNGYADGTMPAEYVGGLGEGGLRALEAFVEGGGTLITFNRASQLPLERLELPVVNPLDGFERSEFYVPGSILRLNLDSGHWLADGMPAAGVAWVEDALAFEPSAAAGEDVEIVGRYAADEPLLSGWISGGEHIAGHGGLAVVRRGRGRIVLFGFRPQYRGQTIATYPLIFNALKRSLIPTESERAAGE